MLETHISWVILTGEYAYKIKKPIDLDFLNYSTLERREFYCHEELRLNRRLAPKIYVAVVPITGTPAAPRFCGKGSALEYAVKMREFPQNALMDHLITANAVKQDHVDALAAIIADFHARIDPAPADSDYGSPEAVNRPVMENFRHILPLTADAETRRRVEEMRAWSERTHDLYASMMAQRKHDGFVRECHGDMHLGNMAIVDGRIIIFDGIEFNDHLRWIHVKSEIAFLCMDFEHRQHPAYAFRFLNGYLEHTGDYEGLPLLPYFQAYRAMVRAKVSRLRLSQPDLPAAERPELEGKFSDYLARAEHYTRLPEPRLLLMRGLSGAGKTTISQALLERLGAIRVRSDVERKRLFAMPAADRSGSALADGIYTDDATQRTYERLSHLAEIILGAGMPAIVDATFLKREQRDQFRELASRLQVPFTILDVRADEETLRRRVSERQRETRDASEADLAVLQHQLSAYGPLDQDEHALSVPVDGRADPDLEALIGALPE